MVPELSLLKIQLCTKHNSGQFSSFGKIKPDSRCPFKNPVCQYALCIQLLCSPPCYNRQRQQQRWVTQCVKHDVIRVFLFCSWCPGLLTGGQTMLLHWAGGREKREAPVTAEVVRPSPLFGWLAASSPPHLIAVNIAAFFCCACWYSCNIVLPKMCLSERVCNHTGKVKPLNTFFICCF